MLKLELNKDKPYLTTLVLLKYLLLMFLKLILILIFVIGERIVVRIMYIIGKCYGEKDKEVNKTKYKRIRKSIRIKLWFWMNLRWLCNSLNLNFQYYEKYYNDKKILRY
jgi:hypothetical protein